MQPLKKRKENIRKEAYSGKFETLRPALQISIYALCTDGTHDNNDHTTFDRNIMVKVLSLFEYSRCRQRKPKMHVTDELNIN